MSKMQPRTQIFTDRNRVDVHAYPGGIRIGLGRLDEPDDYIGWGEVAALQEALRYMDTRPTPSRRRRLHAWLFEPNPDAWLVRHDAEMIDAARIAGILLGTLWAVICEKRDKHK